MKKILSVVMLSSFCLVRIKEVYAQQGNRFYDTFIFNYIPMVDPNASNLIDLLTNIGGFLMVAGGVIAGVVLIAAGLMYMASGSNQTRVAAAKSVFKNGVIGALIIFGFGIIINTVILLGSNPFGFFN